MQMAIDFDNPLPNKGPRIPGLDTVPVGDMHARFLAFHRENQDVYIELRRLALQMRDTGRTSYSIKGLFEVLRWSRDLATRGDSFKLNNNYTAYYARLLMEHEPRLAGMFELRERGGQVPCDN
jgi:hypothetical protein